MSKPPDDEVLAAAEKLHQRFCPRERCNRYAQEGGELARRIQSIVEEMFPEED